MILQPNADKNILLKIPPETRGVNRFSFYACPEGFFPYFRSKGPFGLPLDQTFP
jgi:hypothetical protein